MFDNCSPSSTTLKVKIVIRIKRTGSFLLTFLRQSAAHHHRIPVASDDIFMGSIKGNEKVEAYRVFCGAGLSSFMACVRLVGTQSPSINFSFS